MRALLVAIVLLSATSATAESQIEQLVAKGLSSHGIKADTSSLSGTQLAALHLQLSSPSDGPEEGDMRVRDALLAILEWEADR